MRILSLILMLALVVLIVGCSEPQTADQTDTQDTTILVISSDLDK